MYFKGITVGPLAANCYILADEDNKVAAVVDPGGDPDVILEEINQNSFSVKWIILTHGHSDHIGGLARIKEVTDAQIALHEADQDMLTSSVKNLSMFMGKGFSSPPADVILKGGEKIVIGDLRLEIIHTPGHTPGSISIKAGNLLLTGDTLFEGSVGRTDFPGGSMEELLDSIKNRLLTLGDDVVVYPGHGPKTTIKNEKITNPFLG